MSMNDKIENPVLVRTASLTRYLDFNEIPYCVSEDNENVTLTGTYTVTAIYEMGADVYRFIIE